jgi:hypothetical protein
MGRLLLPGTGLRRRASGLRDGDVDWVRRAHAERVEARLDFGPIAHY